MIDNILVVSFLSTYIFINVSKHDKIQLLNIEKTVYFKGWVVLTTSHIKHLNWIVFAAHDNHAYVLVR